MEVSAKHEGQTLTFFLVGELDHHGAKGLLENLEREIERTLPLSLVLSWYEQKAVSILLTLLALGVKNIRLGPTLPAFVSPNILKVLVEQWNIMPVTTPDEDLKAILG